MKVLKFFTHQQSGHDDPVYHLGFEKYENQCSDFYLMLGDVYNPINSGNYDDKPKVVLTLEEPNFCTVGHHVDTFNKVDKVLTICPYTAKTISNRKFVFFPFNQDLIPQKQEKIYDCIYSGTVLSSSVSSMVDCMMPYKYVFITFNNDSRANHPKVSYIEKLNLYAKTKVTICHNLLWPHMSNIPRYRGFLNADKNKAFDHLDSGLMPQIKSRVFEAAFSRSVILCAKDNWNVIEMFFEPNKDFVYYENEKDLKEKLDHIINNYHDYEEMTNNAYEKAINNYTTEHFVNKFLKEIF
jgi:hypothetical protein